MGRAATTQLKKPFTTREPLANASLMRDLRDSSQVPSTVSIHHSASGMRTVSLNHRAYAAARASLIPGPHGDRMQRVVFFRTVNLRQTTWVGCLSARQLRLDRQQQNPPALLHIEL